MLLLSLWNYDSSNFKINIDHYKIHDKVMRVGYIISPHPLWDASGVRGFCVREGMCLSVISAKGSACFPGTCGSFLGAACLEGQCIGTNLSVALWSPQFFDLLAKKKYILRCDTCLILHDCNEREHRRTHISIVTFAASSSGVAFFARSEGNGKEPVHTRSWCMLTLRPWSRANGCD